MLFPSVQLTYLIQIAKHETLVEFRQTGLKDPLHGEFPAPGLHILVDEPHADIVAYREQHFIGNVFRHQHII